MYRLDVSEHAENDLDKIISYIVEELAAPQAAASFTDEVYMCYERLESNPFIYEEWNKASKQKEQRKKKIRCSFLLELD